MVERVFVHLYVHECVCVGRCSSFKTSTNTVYNCGTCELVAAQYTPTHTNRCNCNCVRVPFEEPTSCSLYLLTLKHCLQSNESYSINKLFFIILPNKYSCFGQLENEKKMSREPKSNFDHIIFVQTALNEFRQADVCFEF